MFSSFASMLPQGINFGLNKEERERDRHERAPQDLPPKPSGDSSASATASDGRKSSSATAEEQVVKKKKERNPNETFIVVRPPPSVSNHPLNLQLQLVPPQSKDRAPSNTSSLTSNRQSVDLSDEVGVPLTRESSGRSGRSDPTSFYGTSSASMSSIASSASTASSVGGRRMIIPLYNLSAHNVMTNTVLDAGTDAKVAKLHKRGMEILALAVLECVEIWPSYGRGGYAGMPMTLNNVLANGASEPPNAGGGGAHDSELLHTPTSSALSLSSAGSHTPQPQLGAPSTPKATIAQSFPSRNTLTPTPATGAKKIFGRIFKKKDGQGTPVGSSHSRNGSIDANTRMFVSPPTSDAGHGPWEDAASPAPSHLSFSASGGSPAQPQPLLQPAVLGIQPTLSSPVNPPCGRPSRYVWIVRKWLKNEDGGLLGGMMKGVNMVGAGIQKVGLVDRLPGNGSGNVSNGGGMGVEVRFEWVRGQSKNADKRKAAHAALGKRFSINEDPSALKKRRSRRSMGGSAGEPAPRMSTESRRSVEGPARDSRRDSITSQSLSEEAQQALKISGPGLTHPEVLEEIDEGEESDPEDSETPWSCTLIISSIVSKPAALWECEHAGSAGADPHRGSASRLSHISSITPDQMQPAAALATPRSTSSQGRPITPTPASAVSETRKSKPDPPGTLLKLKVGALSPAPHHPKVVAQLKVPFPLPDIEVETARVRKRVVTPAGVSRPAQEERPNTRGGGTRAGGGLGGSGPEVEATVLTAEEIKDVLSCTAFWVVVREGFGGVGKEKRKGDGWRIRG